MLHHSGRRHDRRHRFRWGRQGRLQLRGTRLVERMRQDSGLSTEADLSAVRLGGRGPSAELFDGRRRLGQVRERAPEEAVRVVRRAGAGGRARERLLAAARVLRVGGLERLELCAEAADDAARR